MEAIKTQFEVNYGVVFEREEAADGGAAIYRLKINGQQVSNVLITRHEAELLAEFLTGHKEKVRCIEWWLSLMGAN